MSNPGWLLGIIYLQQVFDPGLKCHWFFDWGSKNFSRCFCQQHVDRNTTCNQHSWIYNRFWLNINFYFNFFPSGHTLKFFKVKSNLTNKMRKPKSLWYSCQQGSMPSELNPPKSLWNLCHPHVYFGFSTDWPTWSVICWEPTGKLNFLFSFDHSIALTQFERLRKMSPVLKVLWKSTHY